jgi:hypothetical protein
MTRPVRLIQKKGNLIVQLQALGKLQRAAVYKDTSTCVEPNGVCDVLKSPFRWFFKRVEYGDCGVLMEVGKDYVMFFRDEDAGIWRNNTKDDSRGIFLRSHSVKEQAKQKGNTLWTIKRLG